MVLQYYFRPLTTRLGHHPKDPICRQILRARDPTGGQPILDELRNQIEFAMAYVYKSEDSVLDRKGNDVSNTYYEQQKSLKW